MQEKDTTIEIRPEHRGDAAGVRAVNEAAFGRVDEADLVAALRRAGKASVSLVAVAGGDIVGHILFSPVTITAEDGRKAAGVGLAPMAVRPGDQRSGIGSRLVKAGLQACRDAGWKCCVVLGHPSYYPRFGFVPASRFGVGSEFAAPDEAFMALELVPGALDGVAGTARFQREFQGID